MDLTASSSQGQAGQWQFNPYNYSGNPNFPSPRGWAGNYAMDPWSWPNAPNGSITFSPWQSNTYDRMSFWIKSTNHTGGYSTDGTNNIELGTYAKSITNPDLTQDEDGSNPQGLNNHFYHALNMPASGPYWTHVILPPHPNHARSETANEDPGVQLHPTGEAQYNYFDTLTRFYWDDPYGSWLGQNPTYPATTFIDDIIFYKEPYQENDREIYGITATYVPANRVILTWCTLQLPTLVNFDIRYAFQDIHQIGWGAATPAPNGTGIVPAGSGGYNNVQYDTSAIPLSGQTVVYFAIKPQDSNVFTEVVVPISTFR
jgi:hypothetical protein